MAQPGMARPAYGNQHHSTGFVTHSGNWSQELCECSPCDKCFMGFFPCAHACARSKHDGTNCCANVLTGNPALTQSIFRMNYGIGTYQECCSDIIDSTFCMPCMQRRMAVEAEAFPLSQTNTSTQFAQNGVPRLFADGKFLGQSGLGEYNPGSGQQFMWKAGGLGDCWGGCCSHTFLYALFFPVCAAARARQYLDGSDCCFNVFCGSPWNLYYTTRHYYGIRGQCHEDLCIAYFCLPCAIDRVYREIFANTYADILAAGSCNGCCGGAPVQKARPRPGPTPQQMAQKRRGGGCLCC
eukprot:TRINITY_DN5525_c0_g1_i1.p1 TRINITY_DN5525_c0_g1~~TRINITY_DN5525_c0_g1_i1.p1  ORF type:complete len:296 (+),score=69.13 TRINITY_DN5525_c0_g1_i1:73-960(+)